MRFPIAQRSLIIVSLSSSAAFTWKRHLISCMSLISLSILDNSIRGFAYYVMYWLEEAAEGDDVGGVGGDGEVA